jgi:S4 domain protein YaaA
MQEYILYEEYITLGQVIKELGIAATGGQAKIFLAENEGKIFVNKELENRRGKKLRLGDILEIPEYNLAVTFDSATEEEIAEQAAEKVEAEQLKAMVKKMNVGNKIPKAKKSAKPRFPGAK